MRQVCFTAVTSILSWPVFWPSASIAEQPYEESERTAYEEALSVMKHCRRVICCLRDEDFGEMNERNKELLREARKAGIETVFSGGKMR